MVTVFILPAVSQLAPRQRTRGGRVRATLRSSGSRSVPVLVQPGRPERSHTASAVPPPPRRQWHCLVVGPFHCFHRVPCFRRPSEELLQIVIITGLTYLDASANHAERIINGDSFRGFPPVRGATRRRALSTRAASAIDVVPSTEAYEITMARTCQPLFGRMVPPPSASSSSSSAMLKLCPELITDRKWQKDLRAELFE